MGTHGGAAQGGATWPGGMWAHPRLKSPNLNPWAQIRVQGTQIWAQGSHFGPGDQNYEPIWGPDGGPKCWTQFGTLSENTKSYIHLSSTESLLFKVHSAYWGALPSSTSSFSLSSLPLILPLLLPKEWDLLLPILMQNKVTRP